jgi:diguanylate cyclase (GGDEF)-like protein
MSGSLALADASGLAISPRVRELAERLLSSLGGRQPTPAGKSPLALLDEMLAYAAEAEQQIAEQRQRIAELEALSMTDPLTGLPNLRGFEDFMRRTLAAARRHDEGGVVACIDLDRLKSTNDRFGHEAGDMALRQVARILAANARQSDFVARLHGDEFAVVLVRANAAQGAARIRRLREIIVRTTLFYRGAAIPLSASFGIASYGPATELGELMRRGDAAMYQRKRCRSRARRAHGGS